MGTLQVVHILCVQAYLGLAVYLVVKGHRSPLNLTSAAIIVAFAVWSGSLVAAHDPAATEATARLAYSVGSLAWASFASVALLFIMVFLGKSRLLRSKLFWVALVVPPMVVVDRQWEGELAADHLWHPWGWSYVWSDSTWTFFFVFYYAAYMVVGLALILRQARQRANPVWRRQARIIVYSAVPPLFLSTATDVVLPRLDIHSIPNIAPDFTIIWAVGLVVAIVKYGLLEISPAVAAERVLNTISDAVLLVGANGGIEEVNPAAERLLGRSKGELRGTSIEALFPEALRAGQMRAIHDLTDSVSYDYRLLASGGREVPVYFACSVIRGTVGELAGMACVVRDISARKQAEDVLRDERNELDRMVGLRTRQLEDRIRQLRCVAQVADAIRHMRDVTRLFEKTATVIPNGFRGAANLDVQITLDGESVGVAPASNVRWKQTRDLVVGGERRGTILVHCAEDRAAQVDSAFLAEEEQLLEVLARMLGDAVERIDAEMLLDEHRERLESALRGSGLGMWEWFIDSGRVVYSDRWAEMLGYAKEDLEPTAEACEELVHPEDRGRRRAALDEHLRGVTDSYRLELRYRTSSQGWKWVLAHGRIAQRDETGAPVRMIGSDLDIHKRKVAEAALKASEESFRTLFDEALDGILLAHADNARASLANKAFRRMTGYGANEIGTLGLADLIAEESRPWLEPALEKTRRGEIAQTTDIRVKHKNEGIFVADVSATQVELQGRSLVMVVFRDTSSRRLLEQQLRASQRLEAIGQLAGGIAHDFNNIVAVINSFGGFALDALEANDPVRDDIREVLAAAKRAGTLTRQLLAFSRRQLLQPTELDLNDVLRDLDRMLRRVIGEDIEMRLVLDQDRAFVRADRGQLEQVLMNLAVNARDAMPRGGSLTVTTSGADVLPSELAGPATSLAPATSFVVLEVADTGAGMDEETVEHAFEPFFTTKTEGKGTGLGLATVYGIVTQSGGVVSIDSAPGVGTTFRVYLPRVDVLSAKAPRRPPVGQLGARPDETILLVEDDQGVRAAAKRILGRAGYAILEADSGAAALELLGDDAAVVALLLSDVVMPQMSGPVLAEQVTAIRPGVRVLYMSGYTDDALGQHGVLGEGTNLLQKPFSETSLLRKVREILDTR